MITTKENRVTRFSIRATNRQKEMISRAAQRSNMTISEFVLENSLDAARALELDNAHFVVSREDYEAFLKKLDEPPRTIPALRQLMSDPTSIDVPNN
ncbi:MAG: DUF1778 domain-containing protein [Acidobacteria bacterium]|nr:DUF1778 domain-containing protein [Acidobacteriota bacterium]